MFWSGEKSFRRTTFDKVSIKNDFVSDHFRGEVDNIHVQFSMVMVYAFSLISSYGLKCMDRFHHHIR